LPDVDTSTVLLLGAGGGGAAVAHALSDSKVEHLLIADRDSAAAQSLVDSVNRERPGTARIAGDLDAEAAHSTGIVNATPMGMAEFPGTALPQSLLRPRHWVADIVYFPLETEFLRAAKHCGCQTLDGAGMAVFQAVRAFEHFTGHKPDPDRMRATFEAFTVQGVA
jgi:shikimate dehydrogenase